MAMGTADAQHLLRRAGFGGTAAQIASYAALDRGPAIEALLDVSSAPADNPPAALNDSSKADYEKFVALTHQWIDWMVTSPAPLREKMTLFWHGHFTTQMSKVYLPVVIRQQISFYRANALGSFRALTDGMALQPAMLLYLDQTYSTKRDPNQNFARELLELFTLGVGNYSEQDVIEASRAWTGHSTNTDWDAGTSTYVYRAEWHDTGQKTFMGTTKDWDGPGIIAELFTNATTRVVMAKFIVNKLWSFFAYPNGPAAVIDALAKVFIDGNWEMKPLLRALFNRPEFWSDQARTGLLRSPIEWVASVIRGSGMTAADLNPQWYTNDMGQELFDPPNVAGWKSNLYWVSTSAAGARAQFIDNVVYRMGDRKVLPTSTAMPADQAVSTALSAFHVVTPAARTVEVMTGWLAAQRALKNQGWAEPGNIVRLTLLAPDLQMA